MKKIHEKDIQQYIGKRIREVGGFIHKISDFSPSYKPFDFFGTLPRCIFFIELKRLESGKRLPFSSFQDNQISALRAIDSHVGKEHNVYAGLAIGVFDSGKILDVFFMDTCELLSRIDKGERSLAWDDIETLPDFFDLITFGHNQVLKQQATQTLGGDEECHFLSQSSSPSHLR